MRSVKWLAVAALLAAGCNNGGGVNKGSGNKPPIAHAGNDLTVGVNVSIAFDGSSSTDPDGTIVTYDWDFGDGTTHGSGATVNHQYASAGLYTVTLTVTDNQGATGSDSPTVTVKVNAYDGTYAVVANPSQQACGLSNDLFVGTNVVVRETNGGAAMTSDWGLHSESGVTVISDPYGPLTGNQFVNNWAYSSTAYVMGLGTDKTTYQNAWTGTFPGDGTLTSTLHVNQSDTFGLATCNIAWNVTGTYIGP